MKTGFKYIGFWLMLLLAVACQDEWQVEAPAYGLEKEICLELEPEGMPVVEMRSGNTVEPDSRVEHVIVYVFNQDGKNLLMRYQQELEHPDLKVRVMLPGLAENEKLQIHAVCNYHQLWDTSIKNLDELNAVMLTIEEPDGAFNGAMVMHGSTMLDKKAVDNKSQTNKIPVTRLAARVDLDLQFIPEIPTDKFYLTNIRLCNVPKRSWLVQRTRANNDTIAPMTTEDAVSAPVEVTKPEIQPNPDVPVQPDAPTQPEESFKNYFPSMDLAYEKDEKVETNIARLTTYLFENRRGCKEKDNYFSDVFGENKDMWQTLKGKLGKEQYKTASYLLIEGFYKSGNTTSKASYRIYLGANNYKDFNVRRNHLYKVTGVIKTCNKIDTRVDVLVLGGSTITASFNNPLDAHFNSAPCFGFTRNEGGWELYVEEPDKHPWLEISFSSQYRPRIAGKPIEAGKEMMYAGTRFEGTGSLSTYFYVHTDEYIPENPAANEGLNNTEDSTSWRTGTIVLRDKKNGSIARIKVMQRPAQVVRMPVKDAFGKVKFYNEYFIEYELERKNLTWGFLKYGANPVMTSMINDRWDGLANTRRLYQEAIKTGDINDTSFDAGIYRGAYNGYYTVANEFPYLKNDTLKIINRIPDNHMIKYVLGKNRDRNGNGYIDYDEIVWYVPALDELAFLKEKLEAKTVKFQNSNERFHSSTPYLAGYTAEVPGRAFYVKMGQGKKAFAMRDRQYNVLCCRRKNAWTGDPNSGIGGNIGVDSNWKPNEEEFLPKY